MQIFFNVFCWGIVVAASSAAKNFTGLLVARLFLGIFEATLTPSFITIVQMWWRRREQTYRTACWFASNGIVGVVSTSIVFLLLSFLLTTNKPNHTVRPPNSLRHRPHKHVPSKILPKHLPLQRLSNPGMHTFRLLLPPRFTNNSQILKRE